ncbi:MAG: alpha amylase C-terminal domain-containing protein, partial [Clostridia bacterium]
ITFAMCYAFSENFILPLSHDEVVHLKGALINKVFGDYEHKFAGLKTLLGFMFSHPGKKLTFMGTELAQWNEWSEDKELDWMLLNYPMHIGYHDFVKKLNKTYKKYKPLYEIEKSWSGFTWRVVDDKSNSVLAYERKDKKGNVVLAVSNFSNFDYRNYEFSATRGEYDLILNSDEAIYGGRGVEIPKKIDVADSVSLSIPANSVLYYYCKKK